jgi:cytoskeleton protein RodZ
MRRRRDAWDVSDVSNFASNSGNDKVLDDGPAVGALLRATRLRIGEDLHDIAAMLHIRYPYLEAIEEGRYKDLPGPTYAVGFVRAYAENLGLDSDEVVRRFKTETSGIDNKADLRFPSPIPEGGVPGGAILFVGAMVALLAYGGWYLSTSQDTFLAEAVSPLPESLADKSATGGTAGARTSMNDATQATAAPALQETEVVADSPAVATSDAPTNDAPTSEAPITSETSQATDASSRSGSDDRPDDARAPSSETSSTTTAASSDQSAVTDIDAVASASATEVPATTVGESAEETPATTPEASARAVATDAAPRSSDSRELADGSRSTEAVASQAGETTAAAGTESNETASGPTASTAEETSDTSPTADDGDPTPDVTAPVGSEESDRQLAAAIDNVEAPAETSSDATADSAVGRIIVQARTASWIQVRDDVANKLLLTRLMRPGDVYRVPDRPGLTLLTGNAGALDIRVDGEAVPPLGPVGLVRRDVALDAERLRAGTAVRN